MPHHRAAVEGIPVDQLDATLREARVGVVIGADVENAASASGTPAEPQEVASVTVSVDASDPEEARRKLVEALPSEASVTIHG